MPEQDGSLPESFALLDGREMVVHRLCPDDGPKLVAFFDRLSPRARRLRFFAPMRAMSPEFAAHLAQVDFVGRAALAASFPGEDEFRAVARYHRAENDATDAEVAFSVEDSLQGQGIATHMLRLLTQLALANGITRFTALVLRENEEMLEVFRNSGLGVRVVDEGELYRVEMQLA